jgi:protein associated with RNAse G/E
VSYRFGERTPASKWMTVQAYKHDGKLHRQWSPAYLTVETDEYWALCSKESLVTENDGRRWMTRERAVFFLYKHRWMNVIGMMKEGGFAYYANMASPTIFDKGFLKYIDYDLDEKLFVDQTIKDLDTHEFERHAEKYGYDERLIAVIRKSASEVREAMEKREFPFIDSEIKRIYSKFEAENQPYSPNLRI